jgi:hypothetical protein
MQNLTIENFMIIGQAILKMTSFFWPVLLLVGFFALVEWRKEAVRETR